MRGPCWQFQQGCCRYGAACKFQHAVQPIRQQSNRRTQPQRLEQRYEQSVLDDQELRQWSNASASTSTVPEDIWRLRVMTYNVLADALAFEHARELYNKVPRHLLRFNNRVSQMRNEFRDLTPDILSLQEVDKVADFEDCLTQMGYDHQFAQRSGNRADGCAIFWQAAKLRRKASRTIDFAKLGLRNNVALVLLLETCSGNGGHQILIANTHILFNPKRGEIKVAQIRIILEAIHQMRQEHGGNIPCMFMGDLNLTPDSALYEFIASGQLDCAAVDPRDMSGQQESRSHRSANSARKSPLVAVQVARPSTSVAEQGDYAYDQSPVQSTVQSATAGSAYDALEDMIAMGRAAASQLHASSASQGAHQLEPKSSSAQQNIHVHSTDITHDGHSQTQHIRETTVLSTGQCDIKQTSSVTAEQPVQELFTAAASDVQRAPGQSAAFAQSQQQDKTAPPVMAGGMLTGLALHVQEDRRPFLPFGQSLGNDLPAVHDQPCGATTPRQMPAMAASRSAIGSNHSSAVATAPGRSSSGRQIRSGRQNRKQGGMDRSQLATAHTREVHDPRAAVHHVLEHPLRLQSAYMEVTGSEPVFTSCHDKFCGTVDYIWYSQVVGSHVKPVAVLNPPAQHLVGRGLPTALFPSDHVSIVCDFDISPSAL